MKYLMALLGMVSLCHAQIELPPIGENEAFYVTVHTAVGNPESD